MSAWRPPTWPVIPLALPAAVSIWGGWVGLGQLTGFGVVQLLPGIWDGLRINTAVTLPIGMEAYAAYALHVWLHRESPRRARNFARVSSIVALVLGALGQVAYHLMVASGVESAPWPITAAVACLPVGVLGMGATLAHLLTVDDAEPATSGKVSQRSDPAPVVPTAPQFRPAMSAPPFQPVAPVRPDPMPPVRPEFAPAERPAEQPAERPAERPTGSARTVPDDRPAERPAPTRPERSTSATRNGPARKRPGKPRTDAHLSAEVRQLAEQNGGPPSVYAVKQALGVGSGRAARLLAELDTTPAGSPSSNGAATRKESAR